MLIDAIISVDSQIQILEAQHGKKLLKNVQSQRSIKQTLILPDVNSSKMNGLHALSKPLCLTLLLGMTTIMLSTSKKPKT